MKTLTIVLSALLLCCCGTKDQGPVQMKTFELEAKLLDEDMCLSHATLFMIGDHLLIQNDYAEKQLAIYDMKREPKLITQYGTIGRGPGEFGESPSVNSILGDTIIVSVPNHQEVVSLVFDRDSSKIREIERKKHDFRKGSDGIYNNDRNTAKLENQNYIGKALSSPSEMFSYLDPNLETIKLFGEFEFLEGANQLNTLYYADGRSCVKGNYMVFAMDRLPYIVAYKIDGEQITKVWDDKIYPLEVAVINEAIRFSKEKARGMFNGVTMGDKYIYALFSDAMLSDEVQKNKIIYVYDYEGNIVAKLNLDHDISNGSICVNQNETKIYGFSNDASQIVEYDISKLKKR